MPSQDNIATMGTIIERLNSGDIDAVAQHVSDGFIRHDLSGAFLAGQAGRGEVTDFLHALYASIPDLHIDIADIFGCDEKVTVRYEFTGTHKGALLGVAPTGRRLDFNGINIYRFEEGKIAEAWQLWDWATVLQQMDALGSTRDGGR